MHRRSTHELSIGLWGHQGNERSSIREQQEEDESNKQDEGTKYDKDWESRRDTLLLIDRGNLNQSQVNTVHTGSVQS